MDLVDVLILLMMFALSPLVSSHPLFYPSSVSSAPAHEGSGEHSNAVNGSTFTLQTLFDGNQRFRDSRKSKVAVRSPGHIEETEEAPAFMFLGCSDHRFTPHRIFDAPEGSFFMHNTIANHYEVGDESAEASLAFAADSMRVHHIIILGHYGCKGVETAITMPAKTSKFIKGWIQPIADLYRRHRRKEIVILRDSRMPQRGKPHGVTEPPPSNDPGLRALVEENVKLSVTALKSNEMISAMHIESRRNPGKTKDIFVHGFVHDETTGDVVDLGVSFGPPGKQIPHIPFARHKRTENFPRSGGGVKKGKDWDFGKMQ